MNIPPPPVNREFTWEWPHWIGLFYDFITKEQHLSFESVSAATTITKTVTLVDTSGSAVTVTLPPSDKNERLCLYIKDTSTSANQVTIDGNGSETIDGALTLVLAAGGQAKLICDGSNWHRIG